MNLDFHELPDMAPDGMSCPAGRCIFCDREVRHISDGGIAMLVQGIIDGDRRQYFYCSDDSEGCQPSKEDLASVWECFDCCLYNLSGVCACCRRPRTLVDSSLVGFYRDMEGPEGVAQYVNRACASHKRPVEVRVQLELRCPISLLYDPEDGEIDGDRIMLDAAEVLVDYVSTCRDSGVENLDMVRVISFEPAWPS